MICKKCKSSNVIVNTQKVVLSKSRSIIWNLLMLCITGGLWILWMLIRKRKEVSITETWATCQDCGYRRKVK